MMIKAMNIPKTYLTEAHDVDNKSILRILTQDKQINTSDPKYAYYKKLANWANSDRRQQKLKNVDLNNIKLSDRNLIKDNKLPTKFSTLGHILFSLKNLMDQKGKYNPESELSKLIQQTTLEILAGISGIKEVDRPSEDPKEPKEEDPRDKDPKKEDPADDDPKDGESETDKTDSHKGIDWTAEKAKRLANTEGKATSKILSQFYNDYYRIEYAGVNPSKEQEIINKLKSLDKILIPEFNKLGYNPEVNPFAQFLKNLIKNKYEIFEKLTFNTYGAIHNSFIDQKITGNMLGKYEEYKDNNILYCNDLYNYKGLDIVNYLDLQNQALAASKNSDIENLIAKIFIQQNVEGENYYKKVDNLRKLSDPVLPGAAEAKLRSELEIRELYRYLFGHDAKTTRKNAISKIIQEAADKNAILDMVYYLISQYKLKADFEAEVNNWLKDAKHEPENKKIDTSKEILAKYSNMDLSEVASLIDKLRAYYIKKQKETKKET